MPDYAQIVPILFLMLGPFKLLGPFAHLTKNADRTLTLKLASRSTIYAIIILFLAGFLGENMMSNFRIPVWILAFSGGLILFLVALINILSQFKPVKPIGDTSIPDLSAALSPLAIPTIVTPYGITSVIVFIALNPSIESKLMIGLVVVGIMLINFLVMLFSKVLYKPLALTLAILGAILGVIQVALGAKIIYNSIASLFTT